MDTAVRRLIPLKAGGNTHLGAENFKQCLLEAYHGENLKTPADIFLDVPVGHRSTHVVNGGDPTGVGVDCPGPHT